jgi:hypothetical protein
VPRKTPTAATAAARAAATLLKQQASAALAQTALHKQKFLDTYRGTGNVSAAAVLATIGRRTHYDWIRDDAVYAASFADAVEEAADRLETEARRRAVTGCSEAIYYKGAQIGTLKKYSDTLLIFLLKGARPEKYSDHHTLGTKKGQPLGVRLEDIVMGPA